MVTHARPFEAHDRSIRSLRFARQFSELRLLIHGIGSPAWVCGPTAAALHGFDGFNLGSPFHVAVPASRAVTRVGHVVHRLRAVDRIDVEYLDDVALLTPTRTVIDLARSLAPAELTTCLDCALRDGGSSERFLHERIVALRRRGRTGLPTLLRVIEGSELSRGGHSWLERRFLELAGHAGLPRPATQQVVGKRAGRLIRVDCRFQGTNVVVELLGYRFHRTAMELQADAERLNRMVLDGLVPLQFTYVDVVERPEQMLADVRLAIGRAAA